MVSRSSPPKKTRESYLRREGYTDLWNAIQRHLLSAEKVILISTLYKSHNNNDDNLLSLIFTLALS